MQNAYSIEIAPVLRQAMSVHDLAGSSFTMIGAIGLTWSDPADLRLMFGVRAPGYELMCGTHQGQLQLFRNGVVAAVPLPELRPDVETKMIATVMWTPTELVVEVKATGFKAERRVETPVTAVPFSLLEWLRARGLEPQRTYPTAGDVFIEVVNQLEGASEKLKRSAANNGFWDVRYDGKKILERTPKKETDVHPTLNLLLYDLDLVRGLQVVPEYDAGSGRLDFLISGWSEADSRMVHVCVEFKLAHSRDLAAGLLKQLPAYMQQRQTDFGIFGVVDFGSEFPYDVKQFGVIEEFEFDAETPLDLALEIARNSTGLPNVRKVIFDVSHQVSPSKL
jgi:hypothetical protein